MNIQGDKFKKVHGYEEGKEVLDAESLAKAADYKKNVLKNFTAIDQMQILDRFRGDEYFVTRKYDGEYAIIYFTEAQAVTVNRSGRTRRGIACINEAAQLIHAAGISEGIFPAEIYVEAEYKTRVNDLIHALAYQEQIDTLRLAVFDILEINGEPFRKSTYTQVWEKIQQIFGSGRLCHPVDFRYVRSGTEILNLWKQWVDREQSEGLIVHTRSPFSYKVKPRHFFDAVVLAFRPGSGKEKEQVRTMLFAFIPKSGHYQVMSRVGSGLHELLRKQLFEYFSDKEVNNPFAGMKTNWEEMTFVKPELVIEIAVEEVVTELASGEKTNFLLSFQNGSYKCEGIVSGYRTYTPVFIRLREDKTADEADAGIQQLENFINAQKGIPNKQETHKLLLRDYLTQEHLYRQYRIWKAENDYALVISTNDQHHERSLHRSERFYDLFHIYQRDASAAVKKGFSRKNDCVITTELCIEIMQQETD